MDCVPVSNDGEDQQQERDQQEAGGFRGVDCSPWCFVGAVVLALCLYHAIIVRRVKTGLLQSATLRVVNGLSSFYARFPRQSGCQSLAVWIVRA
jgi:hypothetical protein